MVEELAEEAREKLAPIVPQLDADTIRQGSPYTWVCTKVATMHETQVEEIASDRKMLERLGASR